MSALFPDAVVDDAFGRPQVTVDRAEWYEAVSRARDAGYEFFDFLCGVDEDAEHFAVVLHLWSLRERASLLLRTLVPKQDGGQAGQAGQAGQHGGALASICALFPGANWHEREAFEMFGIVFAGHPGLAPLLLPDEFAGHPLRKDFVLGARAGKAWPGAKEPGESGEPAEAGAAPSRRPIQPPGQPAPDSPWPRALPVETARPDAGGRA
jgi:NADH-quinone oxidoreductase subunit C